MPISAPQTPTDTLDGVLASIKALDLPGKAIIDGAEVASNPAGPSRIMRRVTAN